VVVHGEAQHPVAQDEREWNLRDRGRVDRIAHQVDAVDPVRVRGGLGELGLGDDVIVDENGPDRPAGALGRLGRLLERPRVGAPSLQRVEERAECLVHATPTAVRAERMGAQVWTGVSS
jgi:hypothetical protein